MSDSDINDGFNNNIFTFQKMDTTVSASGPNAMYRKALNYHNNGAPSMHMSRPRYAESVSDLTSMYYRRETSPRSTYSVCDARPLNFLRHNNGMQSQKPQLCSKSVKSCMSVRSMDSTASVADIIFAFKNHNFSKQEERAISEAYKQWWKQRSRKRMEMRRDMRYHCKSSKRSEYDSGEEGGDSSISSDNSCSDLHKENTSRVGLLDCRKTSINVSKNRKQVSSTNMFSKNFSKNKSFNPSSKQPQLITTQEERFKDGFRLPVHRFYSTVIPNSSGINESNIQTRETETLDNRNQCNSDSDGEIFSRENGQIREIDYNNHIVHKQGSSIKDIRSKRGRNSDDDISLPSKKKHRSSPDRTYKPSKHVASKSKTLMALSGSVIRTSRNKPVDNHEYSNSFEFTKPMLPVRKSKPEIQEKIISQSKQPLTGFIKPSADSVLTITKTAQITVNQDESSNKVKEIDNLEHHQSNDVAMRPSFIKRKLFTQNLDIAEKATTDNDDNNSPLKTVSNAPQKEKNKPRKLAATQSCLNRDIQENTNYVHLIQEILPANCIANQTVGSKSKQRPPTIDDEDKWDVISVMSVWNETDCSDTFTDEEIFKTNNKKTNITSNKKTDVNTNEKVVSNMNKKRDSNKNKKTGINTFKSRDGNRKNTKDIDTNKKEDANTNEKTDIDTNKKEVANTNEMKDIDTNKKENATANEIRSFDRNKKALSNKTTSKCIDTNKKISANTNETKFIDSNKSTDHNTNKTIDIETNKEINNEISNMDAKQTDHLYPIVKVKRIGIGEYGSSNAVKASKKMRSNDLCSQKVIEEIEMDVTNEKLNWQIDEFFSSDSMKDGLTDMKHLWNKQHPEQTIGTDSQALSNSVFERPVLSDSNHAIEDRVVDSHISLNDTDVNNTMRSTMNRTAKLNMNLLTLRSHRASNKNKCLNETSIQGIMSKSKVKNIKPKAPSQNTTHMKKISPVKSDKNTLSECNTKPKAETTNKPTKRTISKSNKENISKLFSTPHLRRSPRINSCLDKTVGEKVNKSVQQSPVNGLKRSKVVYQSPVTRSKRSSRPRRSVSYHR